VKREDLILGIDPGVQVTGYALIQKKGRSWEPLDFGCIKPSKKIPPHERYFCIFQGISQIIEQFHPSILSIETQFVYKNVKTALVLGMARGAVLIAAAQHRLRVFEYTPRKAKLAIVGNGSASKYQVQRMIQAHLQLSTLPEPDHAADALALALCHGHTSQNISIDV